MRPTGERLRRVVGRGRECGADREKRRKAKIDEHDGTRTRYVDGFASWVSGFRAAADFAQALSSSLVVESISWITQEPWRCS
jgi:hypothetical protein